MILPKQCLEALLHFLTCAESADLDQGGAPACDLTDVFDALALQVEEGDDEAVGRGKVRQQLLDDLAGFECLFGWEVAGIGCQVLDDLGLGLGKVGVAEFGADAFAIELVEAGVDRDPGDPVRQGDFPPELVESGKHFGEYGLHEILFGGPAGKVGPHDLDDEWVQVLHQTPGGVFIPIAHPRDAGFNVQLRFVHVAFPGHIS